MLAIGAVITGAGGNTTAFIVLSWQAIVPLVASAAVLPHTAVNLYRALIVQQPGVFDNKPFAVVKSVYALKEPPGS
jgi:hypothetical protein